MSPRLLVLAAALVAVFALPSVALASGVGVSAPATSPVGDSMTVHLAGTADEDGLAVEAMVRQQTCPATDAEAKNLQGPRENSIGVAPGSFSLDMNLGTFDTTSGQDLSGPVNVCAYLIRAAGDQSTVAANSTTVTLVPKGTGGGFGVQVAAKQRMSASGTIRISATCPAGCTVKGRAGKGRTVTKHLGSSRSPVTIKLPLAGAIQHKVKQARRKHKTVSVPVTASATPNSGPKKTTSRTVKVS